MKLNKKRIIAREFLILMVCALVFVLAYLGTLPYNYFVNSKIDNLENESQPIKDSIETLTKSFSDKIDKQKWFFDESEKLNATGSYNTYFELWEGLEYL
jgi:predicted negative regulator of RcsB-dependent stress response